MKKFKTIAGYVLYAMFILTMFVLGVFTTVYLEKIFQ